MGAIGIPWFQGSDQAFEAAKIKSERQLLALRQVTSGAGRVMGAMRERRENEVKARLMNEQLAATLGTQAQQAEAESTPTAGQPAGSRIPEATPNDPEALQPEDAPAEAVQQKPSALGRLATGAYNTGIRALQTMGSMTGISEPYSDEMMGSMQGIAQKQGLLAREKRQNARLHAFQGYGSDLKGKGPFLTQVLNGNNDFSGFPDDESRHSGSGRGLTEMDVQLAASRGEPWALDLIANRSRGKVDAGRPGPRTFGGSGLKQLALSSLMSEAQAKHPDWLPAQVDQSISDELVDERAKTVKVTGSGLATEQYQLNHPELVRKVTGASEENVPGTFRTPVGVRPSGGLPGRGASSGGGPRVVQGPMSEADLRTLAEKFAKAVEAGKMTAEEAEDALARIEVQ